MLAHMPHICHIFQGKKLNPKKIKCKMTQQSVGEPGIMLSLPQGPLSLTWEAKMNAYVMENRYMIYSKVLNRDGIRLIGLRRNWSVIRALVL